MINLIMILAARLYRCHARAAGPVGEAGPAAANPVRGEGGSNRARNSPSVQNLLARK
jgi:hypothetical protein